MRPGSNSADFPSDLCRLEQSLAPFALVDTCVGILIALDARLFCMPLADSTTHGAPIVRQACLAPVTGTRDHSCCAAEDLKMKLKLEAKNVDVAA